MHPARRGAGRCARARGACRVAMALAALSGDEQRIIFVQLCNPLDPGVAVAFSSASIELRTLTQAERQQLQADYEAATALGRKLGKQSCKELREAEVVRCSRTGLSSDDLTLLGTLGSVLPAPTACRGWRRSWARARCRP